MNAADQVDSVFSAHAVASVVTLVRQHFPEATENLTPWRDDPETRRWVEKETLDLAFHFPGWSPKLQCRTLFFQLSLSLEEDHSVHQLLGVIIRGMTYEGERWRIVTLGDWTPTGAYLPMEAPTRKLHEICRDLFLLFPPPVTSH